MTAACEKTRNKQRKKTNMIKRDKHGRFMKTTKKAVACKGKCTKKATKTVKSVKNTASKIPAKKTAKKTAK